MGRALAHGHEGAARIANPAWRDRGGAGSGVPARSVARTGQGLPVQFVIGTTESYERLNEVSLALMGEGICKAACSCFVDTDLKIDKPQTIVEFDRDKASQLD